MTILNKLACLLGLLAFLAVSGCATSPSDMSSRGEQLDIELLAQAIRALGPDVDAEEAERAARVAYQTTSRLAVEYQITDPPLVHNTKVNLGLRPRGLCWHWAQDLEARLKQEAFTSLTLHRAVANADNPIRLEHSTVIISRRGDTLHQGIVLDPWRQGGVLFWSPVLADTRYKWHPRDEVLAEKRVRNQRRVAREARAE